MVVLSASVVSRSAGGSGRVLVSRQYVEMKRVRIEGLLVAFCKLLEPHKQHQSQHTYIETSSLRYVYQPLDDYLYVVLMTNLSSNIVDDIFTISLMGQAVKDVCGGYLSDEQMKRQAFEIINIMDELVRPGGYRSVASLAPVHQAIKMESQEEKLHKMIVANKIAETKRTMKEKAKELDREKLEKMRAERAMGHGGYNAGGIRDYQNRAVGAISSFINEATNDNNMGSTMPSLSNTRRSSITKTNSITPGSSLKRGMQLGSKNKRENALYESLVMEDNIQPSAETSPGNVPAVQQQVTPSKPVEVTVNEQLSVHLHQDGSFDNMNLQGQLSVTVNEEEAARNKISIVNNSRDSGDIRFSFITHPKIDKRVFNSYDGDNRTLLVLKDRNSSFPMNTELGLLKWRASISEENDSVPLMVNCWPSESRNEVFLNVEYESSAKFDLKRLKITIPIPRNASSGKSLPVINNVDSGDTSFDSRRSCLIWEIPLVDESNQTGSMEAVLDFASPQSSFFPIDVSFDASETICDVSISKISYVDDNDSEGPSMSYGIKKTMTVDSFTIG